MPRLVLRASLFPAAFLAARLLALVLPDTARLCLLYHLTSRDCPGCGLTRAACHLSRFEPARAMESNPLIFPIACATAVTSARAAREILLRSSIWSAAEIHRRPLIQGGGKPRD